MVTDRLYKREEGDVRRKERRREGRKEGVQPPKRVPVLVVC